MHGIGCFDGMFDGWIVENNLIVNGSAPGISFVGARNCRIVNNTVIRNPLKPASSYPRIEITAHKADGGPYSGVYASDNIVRNNIMAETKFWHATNTTVDHNLATTSYDTGYFVDYAGFDFRPLAAGPLVDTGDATLAPTIDLDGNPRPRGAAHDIGAYEYGTLFADNFESYPAGANIGGQPVGATTWSAAGTGSGGSATLSSAQSYDGGSQALYLVQTATGFRPRATLNLVNGGFIPSALAKGSVSFAVREDPNNPSGTNYYTVNVGGMALSRSVSGGVGRFYFSVSGGSGATVYFTGAQHTYTPGAWNLIEVAFDDTAKAASLYINGGLAATIAGSSANFTASAFTLGLYSSGNTNDKVFFDSLEVSQ
jgi:parallel beta-helix repeat protein